MLDPKGIITIDGPSGAGKSTISRGLAAKLHFTYLDTGAMYRAVGLALTRQGIDLADTPALTKCLAAIELTLTPNGDDDVRVMLGDEDVSQAIRTPEMGMVASRVSANPLVREKLTALQRQLGEKGGIVAEGRDTDLDELGARIFHRFRTSNARCGKRSACRSRYAEKTAPCGF